MKVEFEILSGPKHIEPKPEDFDRNIAAIDAAVENCSSGVAINLLLDTKSILVGIQEAVKRQLNVL